MVNIKFIKSITNYISMDRTISGDCVYYDLNNGNVAKTFCYEDGVGIQIINKVNGMIDNIRLPFANYFEPKQCSPGAPKWNQHIERNGEWYFAQYDWCLPTEKDYMNIAKAMATYMCMFKEEN